MSGSGPRPSTPDPDLDALIERLCGVLAPRPDGRTMLALPAGPVHSDPRLRGVRVLAPILDRLCRSRFGCDIASAPDASVSALLTDCFAERSLRPVLIGLLDFAIEHAFTEPGEGSADTA
ncbi:MAG TPA: hypothetical protein DDZ76_02145 [Xanthomonadales bacterium]|nr:hypothetical protein [Xanthomonadales bacterium]